MSFPETHTFTVVGSGEFPFDMLRYDRCWPKHETETHRLNPVRLTNPRTVTLEGLRAPTLARWYSFGWKVQGA